MAERTLHIPDRFRCDVFLHVLKNLLAPHLGEVPLLLGIHGPSGDGKTYQCQAVLAEMDVRVFLMSGGQMESPHAGEPAGAIRRLYKEASRCVARRECPAAVMLINDIDAGLGNWGDLVQYTVNTQTVYGELMNLADYPNSVEGEPVERIPIIVTGNDFTKLYEPLTRSGRMAAFEWRPTMAERADMVAGIFPELSAEEARRLVEELQRVGIACEADPDIELPIAFFAHLRTVLYDTILWERARQLGLRESIARIAAGRETYEVHFARLVVTFDQVLLAGVRLLNSGQLVNHLERRGSTAREAA